MKIDSIAWEKSKKRSLFFAWPIAISAVLSVFITPMMVEISPKLSLLTPLLGLIVFVLFIIVDMWRHKAETAREKRDLQAKYDGEDKAMFGKPLRELEI